MLFGEERSVKMTKTDDSVYFVAKDEHGDDLLCPINAVKNRDSLTDEEMLNCFEKDVAERYSGNITIDA
jgi:hypothetical protein